LIKAIISRLLILTCFLLWAAPHLFAAESAPGLTNQNEKESYSIGYQVGRSIMSDGVDVDFDKLIQGLQDAINDKAPLLNMEEMRTLILDLKKQARTMQMEKLREQTVENFEESKKFLAENKKKEGVKTTKSGLQYKVMKKGQGISPKPEDFVKVNYRGTFIDGTEFDSSYAKDEPARLKVGGVIKGWTEALQMMKTGSKWQVFIPPSLAYGTTGNAGRIPPNKLLVFEIELLAVEKGDQATKQSDAQAPQARTVKKMFLTGKIAKSKHGYIIRSRKGNAPSEIFTIRNPNPKVLDDFVGSQKTVSIEARMVSGDNVEIEKIDDKTY